MILTKPYMWKVSMENSNCT